MKAKKEIIKLVGDSMNRVFDLSPSDKNFNEINKEMGKQVYDSIHHKKEPPNKWLKNLNRELLEK